MNRLHPRNFCPTVSLMIDRLIFFEYLPGHTPVLPGRPGVVRQRYLKYDEDASCRFILFPYSIWLVYPPLFSETKIIMWWSVTKNKGGFLAKILVEIYQIYCVTQIDLQMTIWRVDRKNEHDTVESTEFDTHRTNKMQLYTNYFFTSVVDHIIASLNSYRIHNR